MIAYVVERLFQSLLVLVTVALVSFAVFQYVSDPVQQMIGQDTSPEDVQRMRANLGLDQPVMLQFARFLGNVVTGNFGVSLRTVKPVGELLAERLPATLELTLAAVIEGIPRQVEEAAANLGAGPMTAFRRVVLPLALPGVVAGSAEEALAAAHQVGYPVVIRPSYVLGGRAMEIVHDETDLKRYVREAVQVSGDTPLLVDRYLADAIEVDVDAMCDGETTHVAGIMEHIEEAGIHSGDSACVLPPYQISESQVEQMRKYTRAFADRLGVIGLINVQYAVKNGVVYVIEVNPRASRTVPFVSKCIGVSLAKIAARCMAGAVSPGRDGSALPHARSKRPRAASSSTCW